jgi:hypothetical protein
VSHCGGEERCIQGSGGDMCGKDLGVDDRVILKWIFMKWGVGNMEWIDLKQGRNGWSVLVNTVMNLRVP